MKKYLIGFGIVAVAGFLMILPYLLRQGAGSDLSNETEQATKTEPTAEATQAEKVDQPKSESKSENTPPTQAENQSASQPATQPVAEPTPQPESKTVDISDFKFAPSTITIKKGTILRWVNKDSIPHAVTADISGPASEILEKDKIYNFTFSAAGVFNYHCKLHPSMKGAVEVRD